MSKLNKYLLEKTATSLINLHGMVNKTNLFEYVNKYYENTSLEEFEKLLGKILNKHIFATTDKNKQVWLTYGWIDPECFKEELARHKNAKYYVPSTLQELYKYQDKYEYVQTLDSYKNLFAFLTHIANCKEKGLTNIIDNMLFMALDAKDDEYIIRCIEHLKSQAICFVTLEQVKEFARLFLDFIYDLRLSGYFGYKMTEIYEQNNISFEQKDFENYNLVICLLKETYRLYKIDTKIKPNALILKSILSSFVHLYGVIHVNDAYKLISKFYTNYSLDEFKQDLASFNLKSKTSLFVVQDDLIWIYLINKEQAKIILRSQNERKEIQYYCPETLDKLLFYAADSFPINLYESLSLIMAFKLCHVFENDTSLYDFVVDIYYRIVCGESFTNSIQSFIDLFEVDEKEEGFEQFMQRLLDSFSIYSNSVRHWELKGNTPNSLVAKFGFDKPEYINFGPGIQESVKKGDFDPFELMKALQEDKEMDSDYKKATLSGLEDLVKKTTKS